MKIIRLLSAMAVFGLLAFTAKAEIYIYNPLNIALVGQVQQDTVQGAPKSGVLSEVSARTTNLTINTKSLLTLIATDQGFTLPPKAKLWLDGDMFYLLKQDNTIFTIVDSNLLSITYVSDVLNSKQIVTTKTYLETITGTSVAILAYNGSSISFTLNCYGKEIFYNASNFTNAVLSRSYSGWGFGSGTCDGQNMVIKGSLKGKDTTRYAVGGGVGTFPPGGPLAFPPDDSGTFPGTQVFQSTGSND
jgi:hypothetical protein